MSVGLLVALLFALLGIPGFDLVGRVEAAEHTEAPYYYHGFKLLSFCIGESEEPRWSCSAYIEGVLGQQLRDVVVHALVSRPETHPFNANMLAVSAISSTFCPNRDMTPTQSRG